MNLALNIVLITGALAIPMLIESIITISVYGWPWKRITKEQVNEELETCSLNTIDDEVLMTKNGYIAKVAGLRLIGKYYYSVQGVFSDRKTGIIPHGAISRRITAKYKELGKRI